MKLSTTAIWIGILATAVQCGAHQQISGILGTQNAKKVDITCPPPSPDGNYNVTFYPNEEDCTKYWECDNGNLIEVQCPDGLVWVPDEDVCDWEYLHPCNDAQKTANQIARRPSPAKVTPLAEITCPPPSPDGNYNATYYPNEEDCTKYWECDNGKLIEGQCPDGLVWVPDQNACDWEYLHSCDTTRRVASPIMNLGTRRKMAPIHQHPFADITCPPPSPDGNYNATYYPNEEDCTKYWECDNGKLIEGQCPDGLVWVPDQNACDWEYLHPCDTALKVARPIKNLRARGKISPLGHRPLADITCPPPSPDGNYNATYYPNEEDCTKYWECDNGKLIEGQCPDGLVWVPDQNVCDWEYLHPCDNARKAERCIKNIRARGKMAPIHHRPLADITCPPPSPDGNYNATYYPNEEDCNKYWECDNGKLIEGRCPDGLVWVPDQNACDWEYLHPCDTAHNVKRPIKKLALPAKKALFLHVP